MAKEPMKRCQREEGRVIREPRKKRYSSTGGQGDATDTQGGRGSKIEKQMGETSLGKTENRLTKVNS